MPTKKNSPAADSGSKVLLIEDNFFMAQLIQDRLRDRGIGTMHVANEQEVTNALKTNTFQAIVIDPPTGSDEQAIALIDAVARLIPGAPILFLLDKAHAELETQAREHGAVEVLAKGKVDVAQIVDMSVQFGLNQYFS